MLFKCVTILAAVSTLFMHAAHAGQSACAKVKIDIKQELSLEGRAFDVSMVIDNGLADTLIEDINIDLGFTNEDNEPIAVSTDPDDPAARFFIHLDAMKNISNVSGAGSVSPKTTADILWRITPAAGSSDGLEQGKLYNIGAVMTYTMDGEENVIEVTPDYIFVKPMPELAMDYFIPENIYADDPDTQETEPSMPFPLGIRIRNTGQGTVHGLKINSAQLTIVDNDQGAPLNFFIENTRINDALSENTLLPDLGAIDSGHACMAQWVMTTRLSGSCTDFAVSCSHGDELGGDLTALMDDSTSHILIRDVRVDLPGRDHVRDFLSKSGSQYNVFESDAFEAPVIDQSGSASLTLQAINGDETVYTLSMPSVTGFAMVKLTDPHNGSKFLKQVTRSDGKIIREENAWQSKIQDADTHQWSHFFNLFDVNTTGTYTVVYDALSSVPQKPVLQFILDKHVIETQPVSFLAEASDPNGTIPSLSAVPLPVGADFIDSKDGTGFFDWTPVLGQKGEYTIAFSASDGGLTHTRQVEITVYDIGDTDMDGMLDAWEIQYFGTLDRDGNGDLDGDGISDLQEFLDNTDPSQDAAAPTTPAPLYPDPDTDTADIQPALVITNSTDAQNDPISYEFEIFSDPAMTEAVARQDNVPQTENTTGWTLPVPLSDNTPYWWRVRAKDSDGASLWSYDRFFVNTQNDPPGAFHISSPADGFEVDTLTPVLSVSNSSDPDLDALTYTFHVYAQDNSLVAQSDPIAQDEGGITSWTVPSELQNHALYYWQATAADGDGVASQSEAVAFYVNTDNHAPAAPAIAEPIPDIDVETFSPFLVINNTTDPDGDTISYTFEIDTSPGFDSPDKVVSGPVPEAAGQISWQAGELNDNTWYYWRVRAFDGSAQSPWSVSRFFVNPMNESPMIPTVKNPGDNAWVNSLTPELSVVPATDPDLDSLEYVFELYANDSLTHFVVQGVSNTPEWVVPKDLSNNTTYFWRARSLDEHGVVSAWDPVSAFFVQTDNAGAAPEITLTEPSSDLLTRENTVTITWEDSDPDSNADIFLYYDTDDTGMDGILIADQIKEDDEPDSYSWDISALQDGTYYIYAIIEDTDSQAGHTAPGSITIDRTPAFVTVSPEGGSFDEILFVELDTNEDADIYYTLDGSDPDINSIRYTAPIEITQTAVLKYTAVDTAGNPSPVETQTYTLTQVQVTLNVITDQGLPVTGTRVYVFKASGTYTGRYANTDAAGNALFCPDNFISGEYTFRIDYLGHQFWSDPVTLPDTMVTQFVMAVETVELTVSTLNGPVAGQRVYLFSETGTYLGQYGNTDENGRVTFILPVGISYTFRADVLGSHYFTDPVTVSSGGTNFISHDLGGGLLTVTLQKDDTTPVTGARLYLFNGSNQYLGKYGNTDESGQVAFEVSQGNYKLRADYLCHQFWSDIVPVGADTGYNYILPHKEITLTVNSDYQQDLTPIENTRVYLFSGTGTYTGRYVNTDADGRITVSLPQADFKIRVDCLGQKIFSPVFNFEDLRLDIPMAVARVEVTGAGMPQSGIRTYLFSSAGSYLGVSKMTDGTGLAWYMLPEGSYRFRADFQAGQYWSPDYAVAVHMENPVTVNIGGGSFDFTLKMGDTPIPGIKYHVFKGSTYTGLSGSTNGEGQAAFDLGDGQYAVRVDYLGHHLWSDPFTVPDTLSHDMVLEYESVDVHVTAAGQPAPAGTRVYLFTENQSYTGLYKDTDGQGTAVFDLPLGCRFTFRADIFGSRYFSDVTDISTLAGQPVYLDTGGGSLDVILQESGGVPIPDVRLYLFKQTGEYVGRYMDTDDLGQAGFDLSSGTYKLRIDYLGQKIWSQDIPVEQDLSRTITLPHMDIEVSLMASYQGAVLPIANIKTYLFNPQDAYTGQYERTNGQGKAVYHLPEQTFKVRADYLGAQYWSDLFNFDHTAIVLPHGEMAVTVSRDGTLISNASVYLFDENNRYLGLNFKTDSQGEAVFLVPTDRAYKFRADSGGSQVWSDPIQPLADQSVVVEMEMNP